MRIKYNRDQKIKGNLTRNFDKDYAFLEKALDRSGDIVKNVFYVGDTADIQSIMEEQTDANTDSDTNSIMEEQTDANTDSDISSATKGQTDANTGNDINSDIGRKTVSKRIVKTTQNNKKIKPKKAAVIYVDGMTDADMVEDFVIPFLSVGFDTEVTFEYVSETGELLPDPELDAHGEDDEEVLSEELASAAESLGRAVASAEYRVKELVARFRMRA